MLTFYRSIENKVTIIDRPEPGCWISAIAPNADEVCYLRDSVGILPEFIRSALDEEESSHIDADPEEGQTLIIIDTSVTESPSQQDDNTISFTTMPLGIILTEQYVVTISLRPHQVLTEMSQGMARGMQTYMKTRFILQLLLRVTGVFLVHLKKIDKLSAVAEQQIHRSMRNQELLQLMGLQKSLVYFSTSLKANDVTLEKIRRGRLIKLYEEDEDLLEDLLIEVRQAIEMCSIYAGVLNGTMDAVASITSNNLNIVMKVLTAASIIMTIPTMVFSFYGMNTPLPLANAWFPIELSVCLTALTVLVLVKMGMFR